VVLGGEVESPSLSAYAPEAHVFTNFTNPALKVVAEEGFEPSKTLRFTWLSTKRVCHFHHPAKKTIRVAPGSVDLPQKTVALLRFIKRPCRKSNH